MRYSIGFGRGCSKVSAKRKADQLEASARVVGGMIEELIDLKSNPNRWRTLPRREGVILRARQIELERRAPELLKSAETLAEWAREDSRELDRERARRR